MKAYTSLEIINKDKKYFSLAIGNFDGVHEGHKALLSETVKDAKLHKGISGVFSFWPHPLKSLKKETPLKLLSNLEKKKELIAKTGIDYCFFIPFTDNIKNLSPEDFIKNIIIDTLGVSSVHVGFNFTFGNRAQGNTDDLIKLGEKYGYKANILPGIKIDENIVSSTFIRQCLEDGEVEIANKLLGYNYTLKGIVVSGDKRGRIIGFPTANIEVNEEIIIPAAGVYAVKVKAGALSYNAVLNIGTKPTFKPGTEVSIEVHILDFNQDIYGETIELEFIKRLREEMKFSSIDELVMQIMKDVEQSREIL